MSLYGFVCLFVCFFQTVVLTKWSPRGWGWRKLKPWATFFNHLATEQIRRQTVSKLSRFNSDWLQSLADRLKKACCSQSELVCADEIKWLPIIVFCFYCCIKEELQTACDILLTFVQNDTRHKICELLAELWNWIWQSLQFSSIYLS